MEWFKFWRAGWEVEVGVEDCQLCRVLEWVIPGDQVEEYTSKSLGKLQLKVRLAN